MTTTADMTATVKELRDWLKDQPDDARVRMAGVANVGLLGWTSGYAHESEEPIVLLAFEVIV